MGQESRRGSELRKIVANTFLTLDGVMQAPGGPEEDPTGGFKLGGWSFNYWDEMMGQTMDGLIAKPFDLLLGRRTYEVFAAHWPYAKNDPNRQNAMAADRLNRARKYVVSRTLGKPDWENSTLLGGDVLRGIVALKESDGPEIQVHGSSNLIQTLLRHGLIDEFRLWIFPLVIGGGKRLFGKGTIPVGFRLLDCKTSKTGVIIATYERSGEVKTGSFELEEPSEAELARRKRLKDEERQGQR